MGHKVQPFPITWSPQLQAQNRKQNDTAISSEELVYVYTN